MIKRSSSHQVKFIFYKLRNFITKSFISIDSIFKTSLLFTTTILCHEESEMSENKSAVYTRKEKYLLGLELFKNIVSK